MDSRLTRLAGWLRVSVWAGIGLLMLVPLLRWHAPDLILGGGPLTREIDAPADLWVRSAGLLLEIPPFAILALGLWQLLGFVRMLRGQKVFSQIAATALRRFGWSLIAASAVLPISRALVWYYLSSLAGDAAPSLPFALPLILLPVSFGVVFGIVFVAFAAVMSEASRLAEENASFL